MDGERDHKWYHSWYFLLGAALMVASAMLYLLHYAIFKDVRHIFIYLLGDLAFMPVEVLLVTIIVHRLLEVRERRNRLEKMNMVIGAFFSEVGTDLLGHFLAFDAGQKEILEYLRPEERWDDADFRKAGRKVEEYQCSIGWREDALEEMRDFLVKHREFLLTLLENPVLLEHETFTDLLWAVFHLAEELRYRNLLQELDEEDHTHLCNDIARAYRLLTREWLVYLEHLKRDYPYLYSLAVRMSPLGR